MHYQQKSLPKTQMGYSLSYTIFRVKFQVLIIYGKISFRSNYALKGEPEGMGWDLILYFWDGLRSDFGFLIFAGTDWGMILNFWKASRT